MVHTTGADRLHPVGTRTLVTWSRSGCYHFRIGDRMGSAAQRMQWGRARASVLAVWSVLVGRGGEVGSMTVCVPTPISSPFLLAAPAPMEGRQPSVMD